MIEALKRTNYRKGAPLLMICRSGARSRSAAIALTAAGYGPCFNIKDGFEGALDPERHRGSAAGWKAEGLPWIQTIEIGEDLETCATTTTERRLHFDT